GGQSTREPRVTRSHFVDAGVLGIPRFKCISMHTTPANGLWTVRPRARNRSASGIRQVYDVAALQRASAGASALPDDRSGGSMNPPSRHRSAVAIAIALSLASAPTW